MCIDTEVHHMPADGSVWIIHNTKYHNAFNGGEEDRVHPLPSFGLRYVPYLNNLVNHFSKNPDFKHSRLYINIIMLKTITNILRGDIPMTKTATIQKRVESALLSGAALTSSAIKNRFGAGNPQAVIQALRSQRYSIQTLTKEVV